MGTKSTASHDASRGRLPRLGSSFSRVVFALFFVLGPNFWAAPPPRPLPPPPPLPPRWFLAIEASGQANAPGTAHAVSAGTPRSGRFPFARRVSPAAGRDPPAGFAAGFASTRRCQILPGFSKLERSIPHRNRWLWNAASRSAAGPSRWLGWFYAGLWSGTVGMFKVVPGAFISEQDTGYLVPATPSRDVKPSQDGGQRHDDQELAVGLYAAAKMAPS